MKKIFILLFFTAFCTTCYTQFIPVDDASVSKEIPFISQIFNRVFNLSGLDPFYKKLTLLKKGETGVVTIVHIGDSHTQAGSFTEIIRNKLQQYFGNAGRGIVFPYQLAESNAPNDIKSSSNIKWQYNRVTHPEIPIPCGVSGFCIRTENPVASINLLSGDLSFNKLKLFFDRTTNDSWILHTDSMTAPLVIKNISDSLNTYDEVVLEKYSSGFSMQSLPSPGIKSFYGASLEKSSPGVIYHTIGVNGAAYKSFNLAGLFWKQLAALKADLFIISLGTNEAQKIDFEETEFATEFDKFLENLKTTTPSASVLITTAPDSYFNKTKSNPVLRRVNIAIQAQCDKLRLPIWDLFRISNGMGSAYNWMRLGLMNTDRIHYLSKGYNLQGQLLFNALAKGYNDYTRFH